MITKFSVAVLTSVAVIAAAMHPVFAAKSCNDDPSGNPKEVLRLLDEVEAFIPFVPPEEVAYFEREQGTALRTATPHRIEVLAQRPYYYAWQLHTQFDVARGILKQIDDIPEIIGLKMRIMMASRAPFELSNARSTWDDHVWTDYKHTLSRDQVRVGTSDMTKVMGMADLYIWCLASLIDEKK